MANQPAPLSLFSKPPALAVALALWLLPLWALAQDSPLKPIDTSSPRATLHGFLEFMDKSYAEGIGVVRSYLDSPRLFLTPDEILSVQAHRQHMETAERTLDLSEVAPAMSKESARRLSITLKEVLDRIDVPPPEAIPDAEAMAKAEFKRWTLPNSEIRIHRVESGSRAGEYLFTPETLNRLPEFYARVKDLPYKPGASVGWQDFASYAPSGVALALRGVVPVRWLIDAPQYQVRTLLLDQPVWRWLAIAAVLAAAYAAVLGCFRLSHHWAGQAENGGQWSDLIRPLSLVIVAPIAALILADVLRVSGAVYQFSTLSLWSVFYLALTWAVWVAGGALATSLIAAEELLPSSIDSQLIRLVMRLATVVAAIIILVTGADHIGLPAYSVLAGLGVGGLAVALAAQQTLANLLGSLIIMFEKPFAVGHWIKLDDVEGVVEAVGFRSTRIRTFHNSLVTIPSSQLVNSTIDNMELRDYRQVKASLGLTYDTPPAEVEGFAAAVRQLLAADPDTRKDNIQVALYALGESGLEILLNFFLKVANRDAELAARQRIMLAVLRLAEAQGVQFAFPTQTLHIESLPPPKAGT